MPIYEYQCKACDERMEFIQRASESPKSDCPKCGEENSLTKLISSPAIQFKGSGWYLTDYSDKGKKRQAKEKNESSADGSEGKSSDSTKADDAKKKESTVSSVD